MVERNRASSENARILLRVCGAAGICLLGLLTSAGPLAAHLGLFCLLAKSVAARMGRYYHRQPALRVVRRIPRDEWADRVSNHALMVIRSLTPTRKVGMSTALQIPATCIPACILLALAGSAAGLPAQTSDRPRGIADPQRLAAMGWSHGGSLAAYLSTHSRRFRAISVGAGETDQRLSYAASDGQDFHRSYLRGTPWERPDEYARTSAITNVGQACTPTIVHHERSDARVPPANANLLYRALRDVGGPTRLILYNGGHAAAPREELAILRHDREWFRRHVWNVDQASALDREALPERCRSSSDAGSAVEPEESDREADRSPLTHSCIVLPGSWSNATRSFAIRSAHEAGQLTQVSEVRGGEWHQRAAIHPGGEHLYVSAVIANDSAAQGIYVFSYPFDRESCAIGSILDWVTATANSAMPSRMRYYGLEMHPTGRYLYQTTESVREIRFYRVGQTGALSLAGIYDVTQDGTHVCAHTRRLELHPDGRTLYSNCNNNDAGEGVDYAVQAWRVEDDGRLRFLEHHSTPAMDAGVFDPTVHPNGRWLYQPISSGDADAPAGRGAYILLYDIDSEGRLQYRSSTRVVDPDADSAAAASELARAEQAELSFTAHPTTILIHSDGTHAYVTLHDQANFTHHVVVYRIAPDSGELMHVSTINTATTGTGNHNGGVLANRDGRTFLYTFLNLFPGPEGVVEQYEISQDYRLVPLNPHRIPTGLKDARHPIAVPR